MDIKHQKHWGIGTKARVSKSLSIPYYLLKSKLHKLFKALSLKLDLLKSKLPKIHLPKPISSWLNTSRHKFFLELSLAIVLIISSYIAIAHQIALNRYHLLPSVASAVGPADTSLLSKVHYSSKDSAYVLNAPKTPASSSPSLSVGSSVSQPGYSFNLPTHLNKGISVTDPASELSMEMVPTTAAATGHQVGDHYVYPLDTSEAQDIYSVKANGLEEDIALPNGLSHSLSFGYTLKLPSDLVARQSGDGVIGIYSASSALFGNITYGSSSDQALVDKARQNSAKNTLVFALPAPVIEQANKPGYPSPTNLKAQYILKGNSLSLVVAITKPTTSPILIDPSIVVASASSFSAGNNEGDIAINSTNNTISEAGLTGGSVSAGWTTNGTSFTNVREQFGTVAYNGYLYIVGGIGSGGYLNDVQYAPINTNGTIGSWSSTSSFVTARGSINAVAYNGYIYIIGGVGAPGYLNDVQYAPINSNGMLGGWNATTSIATAAESIDAVVYNGYLYALGGYSGSYLNTVQYAPINANGTIGNWTTTASFTTGRNSSGAVAYNGYLYIVGGNNSGPLSDVQYAPINSNGSVGTWAATTSLPAATSLPGVTVYNGYLYLIGGYTSSWVNSVQYAAINANGTIGNWTTTASFTTARWGPGTVAYKGYLYVMGGYNNGSYYNDVQYAPIDPAGVTGAYSSTTALPQALYASSSDAYNGYIYELGGYNTTNGYLANVYYAPINSNGTIGSWTSTTALPQALYGPTSAVYNGYIYEIGGAYSGTDEPNVYYAPINSNGTIGSWTSTTALTQGTYLATSEVYNGYLYEIAGSTSGGATSAVYYAPINSNGTIGSWTSTTALTQALYAATSVVYGGYIYEMGGYGSGYEPTVYYAPINSNGTIGSWTSTTNLPDSPIYGTSVAQNGFIYVLGGDSSGTWESAVYYAPINSNGTIGAWTSGASLSLGLDQATSVVYDGYVYELGGWNSSGVFQSAVYYAQINNGGQGTLSSWGATTSLLTGTYNATSVAYNGYVYEIGGFNSSGAEVNTVDYAPINSNGTIGSWTATTSLLTGTTYSTSVVYNGYVYELGGSTGSGMTAAVDYAPINSNGTIGSWTATTSLPAPIDLAASVSYDGYVYEIGGHNNGGTILSTVDYAPINSNGTIGSWTATTSLLTGTYEDDTIAYNGYLYSIGGLYSSGNAVTTVDYAPINSNGTIGSWTATSGILTGTRFATSVAYNGYLYETGGLASSAATTVDYAPINTNGTLGSWTATTSLQTATYGATSVAYNGYVYEIGGYTSSATTTVDYAGLQSIPRVGEYSRLLDLTGSYGNGKIGGWTGTTSLPIATEQATSAAYNGYLYEIGGYTTTPVATVDYAPINSNGTIGSWTATTSLPADIYSSGSVAYNGYLYEIGGSNDSGDDSKVYYAPINSNGTIGSWTATTSLPIGNVGAASVVYNGYLYEIGGNTGSITATVDYAPINSNGTIGSWTATTSLPTATDLTSAAVYNGYVYLAGGRTNSASFINTVDYAPINSNGTIGTWTATTSLPTATRNSALLANQGYIYEIGGSVGSNTATVDYAPINSNGTIGSWTATTSLPTATSTSPSVIYNGQVYEIGGNIVGPSATVDYAQVNGDDPTPIEILTNGTNTGNPGLGGLSGLGTGGIDVIYSQASNACATFSTPSTLSTGNSDQISTPFKLSFTTSGCGATSNMGRYVWVHYNIDDSQTASFPDSSGNHTTISNLTVYYHSAATNRLRGGETFSSSGLQSLDAAP